MITPYDIRFTAHKGPGFRKKKKKNFPFPSNNQISKNHFPAES